MPKKFKHVDFDTVTQKFRDKLRPDTDEFVWWKGRRQSDNIEDARGRKMVRDPMLETNVTLGPISVPTKREKLPKQVPIPPERPRFKSHNNLVTPGKWRTK